VGISGIAAPCACGTHKVGRAIGWKGIMVEGEIALMGPASP
jgi:hypothetical protein